jgi:hypothetical protein
MARLVWFDAGMSDRDTDRIRELERGFRHDGVPNLIVDYSAAEDIFTRAIPFLTLVFLAEVVNGLDAEAGWQNLALALAGLVLLVVAFGILNVVRGRRFLSIPSRVSTPELVAFVVLPALLPIVFSGQYLFAFNTVVVNLILLGLVYLVIGFGTVSIVRWTGARFFTQLAAGFALLVRAVPLLLFFSLISFFTTEMWQTFGQAGTAVFWTSIVMFVVLGVVFLVVRLPGVVREIQADSDLGDEPLRPRERVNLAAVALISESLQVMFVSAAVWIFYVVLGSLLVSEQVRISWMGAPGRTLWSISWFGDVVQVTAPLLRVATAVAAFAGLYYAVAILLDAAYRDQFVDALTEELRGVFGRRAEYLTLVRRREAALAEAGPADAG